MAPVPIHAVVAALVWNPRRLAWRWSTWHYGPDQVVSAVSLACEHWKPGTALLVVCAVMPGCGLVGVEYVQTPLGSEHRSAQTSIGPHGADPVCETIRRLALAACQTSPDAGACWSTDEAGRPVQEVAHVQ